MALDASALLALLRGGAGARKVESALAGARLSAHTPERPLSLGKRFCLALARRDALPA